MPKMGGIECVALYREWEAQERTSRLPIYALTGNTEGTENCVETGFDEVISKTNYKENLLAYVQQCL